MLLGGGRISLYLGAYLMGAGIRVKIIERDEEHCETIKEILPKAEVLLGDGTDPKVLDEEGIRSDGRLRRPHGQRPEQHHHQHVRPARGRGQGHRQGQ